MLGTIQVNIDIADISGPYLSPTSRDWAAHVAAGRKYYVSRFLQSSIRKTHRDLFKL